MERHVEFFVCIGKWTIVIIREVGRMLIFLMKIFYFAIQPPYKVRLIIKEMYTIGVASLVVIVLTSSFTGMVLGLQGYNTLKRFGAEAILGSLVSLSLIRELGPVLGALMVTARAGSAMSAEIGIMKISEQVDALDVMTLEPIKQLVVPKIIAGVLVLPILVSIFDIIGIYGGYLVGVKLMGVNQGSYFNGIADNVVFKDIYGGFIKSIFFGLLLTWVCCYKGYMCGHGAKGVSRATTEAVVLSAVLILMWDYFLTTLLL